jgi:hypothetical protein
MIYIPATPSYGVYISQLIRYSKTCGSYHDSLYRGVTVIKEATQQMIRSC